MIVQSHDCPLRLKADGDGNSFRGYFAKFNNVDRAGEVILPGAFKNLDEFTRGGWIGANHDMKALPVAIVVSAVQDSQGLLIAGKFHTHEMGQATRTVVTERLRAGRTVSGSIGYEVLDDSLDFRDGQRVRLLKAINLFECSFVNLPANPQALITEAKGFSDVHEQLNQLVRSILKASREARDDWQVFFNAFRKATGLYQPLDDGVLSMLKALWRRGVAALTGSGGAGPRGQRRGDDVAPGTTAGNGSLPFAADKAYGGYMPENEYDPFQNAAWRDNALKAIRAGMELEAKRPAMEAEERRQAREQFQRDSRRRALWITQDAYDSWAG